MSHPYYLNKHILGKLPLDLSGYTILDACCGAGDWSHLIRTRKEGNPDITGIEIYKPYVDKLRVINTYDRLYNEDIETWIRLFDMNRYDVILFVECAEHIEKEKSIGIIKSLDKMCDKIMIVTTPINFVQTNNMTEENEYNYHISHGFDKVLIELGFNKFNHSLGLHINFFLKNMFCKLTGRNIDSISNIWWKEYE